MTGINRIILLGRVSKVYDFRGSELPATIEIDKTTKSPSGQMIADKMPVNLIFTGKQAQNANKLLKLGLMVYVEGSLSNYNYEKDGIKHYATKVIVSKFQMIYTEKKQQSSNPSSFSENPFE